MRKVLWFVLILSIIFLIPLVNIRVSNEINNNSVILAYDCQKSNADKDFEQLSLIELKECGISSVILSGDNFDKINTQLYENLIGHGFQIILNLSSLEHSKSYYKELEGLIQKYNIRYLLINDSKNEDIESQNQIKTKNIEELTKLINRNNLVFYVMENKEQTGYIPVPGLEALIYDTDYSLNRAFVITPHREKINDAKDASMIWFRAVADRNIRLICVEPLFSSDRNDMEVLKASKSLSELLIKKGFVINEPIEKANSAIPKRYFIIPIIINIIASIALFLDYSGVKRYWLYAFFALASVFFIIWIFVFKPENNIWSAFAAAVIYPLMTNAVLLNRLKNPSKNFFILLVKSLILIIALNGIGAFIVIASMCDIRYTMGLINFDPVIPAFIIPLILFNLNFMFLSPDGQSLFDRIREDIRKKGINKYIVSNLIYLSVCCTFISIYLVRSGNYNVLPEFSAEIKMREFLELVMTARPRTKEFAIAYPSLFVFLYLYQNKVRNKLVYFFGTLASIIGISVINSFCHGFTPVMTSINRTFNGLLLGTITGSICLGVCCLIHKFFRE